MYAHELDAAETRFHFSQGRPPEGYFCLAKERHGDRHSPRQAYMREYMRMYRRALREIADMQRSA